MKNENIAHTPKDIIEKLQSLVAEAEALLTGSDAGAPAGGDDSLRSRFNDVQERMGQAYDGARKQVVAGARRADTTIRENPYQSLAVALGIGVLLGVLVGRRGK